MSDLDTKNNKTYKSVQLYVYIGGVIISALTLFALSRQVYLLEISIDQQSTIIKHTENINDYQITKSLIDDFKPKVDITMHKSGFNKEENRFEFSWSAQNLGGSSLKLSDGFSSLIKTCDDRSSVWDGKNWHPAGWEWPASDIPIDWTDKSKKPITLEPGGPTSWNTYTDFHPRDYDFLPNGTVIVVVNTILIYDPDQEQKVFREQIERLKIEYGGRFVVDGAPVGFPYIRRLQNALANFRLINGTWENTELSNHCMIEIGG
ncbi:hypothetical protein [Allomesorhizobium camelthorni]|uniref:Uncharacterized protein n=1 Tax=Allomesorhizobium camelthorni TaxID=475069 RepID=A0A6G4WHM4_9HYPH|nr:hypothetical protein [Mesorhizobium camelthorni]NGO54099.1 hypothetical protein [Mesorhizobium camelthorni]